MRPALNKERVNGQKTVVRVSDSLGVLIFSSDSVAATAVSDDMIKQLADEFPGLEKIYQRKSSSVSVSPAPHRIHNDKYPSAKAAVLFFILPYRPLGPHPKSEVQKVRQPALQSSHAQPARPVLLLRG